ncbi:MAG TPA: TonB-dependent receptor [Ottowia sp.]|uniref:TonB-dependent receptor n=1 Tax=Ottowia sp. TaxID=1898956 RepID=UPI002CF33702|nr:TonB-dependent receptor [Ottowia sp.]HMN22596.1 TonB-dependent receptor [Ottowia sp.]
MSRIAHPLNAIVALLPLCAAAQDAAPVVADAVAGSLAPVTVTAPRAAAEPLGSQSLDGELLRTQRPISADTAQLLRDFPGYAAQTAGGVSSLPAIRGLGDDRLRIELNGMSLISSCGNHMNPPLSYVDPTRIERVRVFAGVVPVSVGGDSIGATVQVDAAEPVFAAPGAPAVVGGELTMSGQSNGNGVAAQASAHYATERFSLRYDGALAQADNYRAGRGFKPAGPAASDKPDHWLRADEVGSTAYKTRNHALTGAWRGDDQLVELGLGLQDIPYQYYPNQRMDMTRNDAWHANLRYEGRFDWGRLEARAWHERTRHGMQFGADKQYWYGPENDVPGMPMDTRGRTTGVRVMGELPVSERDTVRVGAEALHYSLDDWWEPSGGGMAPNTFWNIRDGRRDRIDLFAEWQARWSPQWLTLIGLRSANTRTDTGQVAGYNANYDADAKAFNARDRRRTDHNWDLAALARFTPNANASYEFGVAHKMRSPNLYERYAWSTGGMAMRMVNLTGDGNGYVGNPDLKPEQATTLSVTADWHDATAEQWGVRLTPYYTHVRNYVDALRCGGASGAMAVCNDANLAAQDAFVYLRFANQTVRLYGVDLNGFAELGRSPRWGQFVLSGGINYVRGKNTDTGDNLINMMPLNARLALTHRLGGWSGTAEWVGVAGKTKVSRERNEMRTGGYALLNLRAGYAWKQMRLDFGIDNVFDRYYELPLGGAYLGQGRTMAGTAVPWGVSVPGRGRSFNVALSMRF